MKIAYITAGAGGMYCGNCLRDNALAAALLKLGHDVRLIPLYTPLRTDEENVASDTVFYSGINAYLQLKSPFFRKPRPMLDWMLDHPALLRLVSKFAIKTEPDDLGAMTVSVLRGAAGPQAKELRKLIDWLKADPPQLVYLTNTMLASIAPFVRAGTVDGVPPTAIDAEQVGREHLRDTCGELLHSSELISDAVAEGRLAIVGANYRLAEGTAVPDVIVGRVDEEA